MEHFSMETIGLERSIWIDAPRERIWQTVTNPDQMIQWLVPNLPGAHMKRDDSGKISVQLGPMSVDFAVFEAVDEPQQVTIRTLPDRLITTTYILEEEKAGTKVTVKVSGFEGLNEAVQQDRLNLSSKGWEQTLKNLNAFVAGAELPFPQAFIGPLFGYWRETQTTLATERSIWIDAPRERVWRAITDPKQIQSWSSPATPWGLSALEVGGRFYVKNTETNTEMYVEIIELLDPPYQLATRTMPEAPDTIVKGKQYTLKEEMGGTRLTVMLSGYEQEPEASRWSNMEQNAFGFGMMLQNTKAFIEGEELPFPFGF
jgi:uncharacterized protein YndB with AHSA1/START domain